MPTEPTDADSPRDPIERMAELKDRGKSPASASILNKWVQHAVTEVGVDEGRVGWLVASTVVVAALQRALDEDGESRFLLKGGNYLQHRMRWSGRPTKDIDGLVRGDIDHFVDALDESLRDSWGPLELTRTEIQVIDVPHKRVKPRRFHVQVGLRGQTWRNIQVEIAPDEGGAAGEHDVLPAPDLKFFGIPTPDQLFGIALRFQVAQKIHAGTDPHSPPERTNDRARDVVDLLLLRDLIAVEGAPSPAELRQACVAVFEARADEANAAGSPARVWPPTATAHPHWGTDYASASLKASLLLSLDEAVTALNEWIAEIDAASSETDAASSETAA
jgi:hypothetical protein